MALCECKNSTRYYCFVHHAHVCLDCVSSHPRCVVGLFIDWLNNPDYTWPPLCPICSSTLPKDPSATTRLLCFHQVHTACLEASLAALPPSTAPAGYACPVPSCGAPVVPHPDASSSTARALRSLFAPTPWYARIKPLLSTALADPRDISSPAQRGGKGRGGGGRGGGRGESLKLDPNATHSPPASSTEHALRSTALRSHSHSSHHSRASPAVLPKSGFVGVLGGSARKKPNLDFSSHLAAEDSPHRPEPIRVGQGGNALDFDPEADDGGENKYRRRSFWRVLSTYIPFLSQSSSSATSSSLDGGGKAGEAGFRIPVWLVYVLALVCFVVLVAVGMAMRSPPDRRQPI